jgi:hypothetical protein
MRLAAITADAADELFLNFDCSCGFEYRMPDRIAAGRRS